MKKRIPLLLVFLIAITQKGFSYSSQTFFSPRTVANDSALELSLSNYHLYHNYNKKRDYLYPKERSAVSFQNTLFYQTSTHEKALAKYFLLGNKQVLQIAEKGTVPDANIDVNADWLQLGQNPPSSDFASKVKLRPTREMFGSAMNFHFDLSNALKGLWINWFVPVVKARHKLTLEEFDIVTNGNPTNPANAKEALNPNDWRYSKFSLKAQEKWGVDDVSIKLGWNDLRSEKQHIGFYYNLIIPMGNGPESEFLFEPIVGSRHWSFGVGSNLDFELSRWKRGKLSFQLDARLKYSFAANELRFFDLTNGQWSRYLLVALQSDPTTQLPGINFFTKKLRIKPKGDLDVLAALHYNTKEAVNFEAGYNFYWRDSETASLAKPWSEKIGVPDPNNPGATANSATINQALVDLVSDGEFKLIPQSQLNLESATHKSVISHKIFAGTSLHTRFFNSPSLLGFGGSYEIGKNNTALRQWTLWLKIASAF